MRKIEKTECTINYWMNIHSASNSKSKQLWTYNMLREIQEMVSVTYYPNAE